MLDLISQLKGHQPMTKQDLTPFGKEELSLNVFNDEGLYSLRHDDDLFDILDEVFIYSEAQAAELRQDLIDDLEEA